MSILHWNGIYMGIKKQPIPKAELERLLVTTAVREAWTGGLGLADATTVVAPVDLGLVEAKHGRFLALRYGERKTPKKKMKADDGW